MLASECMIPVLAEWFLQRFECFCLENLNGESLQKIVLEVNKVEFAQAFQNACDPLMVMGIASKKRTEAFAKSKIIVQKSSKLKTYCSKFITRDGDWRDTSSSPVKLSITLKP